MKSRSLKFLQKILVINILGSLCIPSFAFAGDKNIKQEEETINLDTSYLEPRNELEDYILDTGDFLEINFINDPEISGNFLIDEKGEILLPKLRQTYLRGLTLNETINLLEKKYAEFMLAPEIFIRIKRFKSIRISIGGEVRNPGIYNFKPFIPDFIESNSENLSSQQNKNIDNFDGNSTGVNNRSSFLLTSISDAINAAGGLTSFSDLSKIKLIRTNPISKGGGKKIAFIDLNAFINGNDTTNDLRIYDGDSIVIPKLEVANKEILPKSIISGLTPSFITVSIGGKIENPGVIKIPNEGALSDAMDISGPRKPLSGNVFILRYNRDGSLSRQRVKYSSNARPGTRNNPYLVSGDLITVKDSIFGRSTGFIKTITEPFIGIYTTKELIDSF